MRTMPEVDVLLRESLVIRAKALINIELHLGAVSDLRTVFANEGTRLDELLDERLPLCDETAESLLPLVTTP